MLPIGKGPGKEASMAPQYGIGRRCSWRSVSALALIAGAAVVAPPAVDAATFESAPCPKIEGNPQLDKARWGFPTVPETRAKPAGRTIRLRVAILPALNPLLGSDP